MTDNGKWWIRSEQDPRWNAEGEGQCGGCVIPDKARAKLDELKRLLGQPPADLVWGYMKD